MKKNFWTTVITPSNSWFDLDLIGIFRSRDLIFLLVRRDFVTFYKQTILGPLWFFIQPLLTTIVFTVVFGKIANVPTDGVPPFLFYMSGVVAWGYFSSCLDKTANTFISNSGLFGKVYFPRLVVPIASITTNLLTFFIQFISFICFLSYFCFIGSDLQPNWWILVVPLLLFEMALLGMGVGLLISALTTKYRDLVFVVGFGVQLWMYATPIVYPVSQAPIKWQWIFAFNPMASIVEVFRHAFLGSGAVDIWHLMVGIIVTVIVFFLGLILFSHAEKNFMDTV
jgi:lipopolysaccharide transport system permease protein